MNRIKKCIYTALMLLMLSCGTTAVLPCIVAPITVEAAAIEINTEKVMLARGETYELEIIGTRKTVTWKSNNPSVAKVNSNGKVTAKKAGKTKITAKVNGKEYICIVKVYAKKSDIPKTKFSVSTTNVKINKSGSVDVTFGGKGSVVYEIGNTNICSCYWSGEWIKDTTKLNIVGKKSGTTTVIISNSRDTRKFYITVKVNLSTKDSKKAYNFVVGKVFHLLNTQRTVKFTSSGEFIVIGYYGSSPLKNKYCTYVFKSNNVLSIDGEEYRFSYTKGMIYLNGNGEFSGSYELV